MLKAFDIVISFVTIAWGMVSNDMSIVALGLVFLTVAAVMDQHMSVHVNRWFFRTFFVRRVSASTIGTMPSRLDVTRQAAPAGTAKDDGRHAEQGNRASRRAAEAQARARRLKAA